MRNIVGKPVSGADFFGREGELQSLIEALRNQHVLLLAPRRVGKTSLLFALASFRSGLLRRYWPRNCA